MSGLTETPRERERGSERAPLAREGQDLLRRDREEIKEDVDTVLNAASETALDAVRRVRKVRRDTEEEWNALRRGPEGKIAA